MFTVDDAPGKLNDAQKKAWVKVANSALDNDKSEDSARGIATRAITIEAANLFEVGRILSKKNEDQIRQSVTNLVDILNKLARGEDVDDAEVDKATKNEEAMGVLFEALNGSGGISESTETPDGDNLEEGVVPLVEAVLRRDGTVPIKIISPGWGSSGYYSEAMLKRDGPKVFKKGTKMYWDHPSKSEAQDRPERSLRDLAAILASDATYKENGPTGPGLYSDASVMKPYRDSVEELAPHIGTSIRAFGNSKLGEAEGRKGQIIENFTSAASVDFVTTPGRGGEIVQMFEAARGKNIQVEGRSVAEDHDVDPLEEVQKERDGLKTDNQRLTEALAIRDARDVASGIINGSDLHDAAKERLLEAVSKNPPIKDGELDEPKFKEAVESAVKAEEKYIAKLTGRGEVRGMGEGASTDVLSAEATKQRDTDLTAAFGMMGLSESAAKSAAQGRLD